MRAAARWTKVIVPSTFGGVSSHTVTSIAPGVVIVCGGEDGPRTLVNPELSLWKYEKGTFSSVKQDKSQAVTLLGHTSFGYNGKLHVFGGRRGGTMGEGDDLNDLWSFDEATSSWSLVEVKGDTKPAARSYHANAIHGHHLYVFGGCSNHSRLNDLWRFDFLSHSWELLDGGSENGPTIRGGPLLFTSASGDHVFVSCGFCGHELNDTWKFDLASRRYTRLTEAVIPGRSVATVARLGNTVLVFGGERDPGTEGHKGAGLMRDDVFSFDETKGTFTLLQCEGEEKPCPRGWMEWAPVDDKTLLLVGGLSEDNKRLNDAYLIHLN